MIARSVLEFSPGAAGPLLAREDASEPDWRDLAECQYTDPEIFFPERGGTGTQAKRICRRCDARIPCLDFALATNQEWGVWGGLSEQERRRLRLGPAAPRTRRPGYCGKDLHVKDTENTGPDGRCLTCRQEREARNRKAAPVREAIEEAA